MAYLVLVRHTESEWNAKGVWTGLTDISLSESGKEKARIIADEIKNIQFDHAFVSKLKRAKETLFEIQQKLQTSIPTSESEALNERDYGVFTGKNKWEIQKQSGEEEFKKLRRGWDYPIKNGETLKDVYNRIVPYYQTQILPYLKNGKNVLIVAHGNSLRALVKYLENIPDEQIPNIEIATGEILIYEIAQNGKAISKKETGVIEDKTH